MRALGPANYRLFFGGQSVSLIGTWMTRIATAWLVYRLTVRRPCWALSDLQARFLRSFSRRWPECGWTAGTGTAPWWSRRCFPCCSHLGWPPLRLAAIINISAYPIPGVGARSDQCVRHARAASFCGEMVDRRDDLSNAIALNSSMVNAARLIGPAFGRRFYYRGGIERGLLFSAGRLQLYRGHHFASGHATSPFAQTRGTGRHVLKRTQRRLALREPDLYRFALSCCCWRFPALWPCPTPRLDAHFRRRTFWEEERTRWDF